MLKKWSTTRFTFRKNMHLHISVSVFQFFSYVRLCYFAYPCVLNRKSTFVLRLLYDFRVIKIKVRSAYSQRQLHFLFII